MEQIPNVTESQLLELLRQLPEPALVEVKEFLSFLKWRYQQQVQPEENIDIITALKGKATANLTTDEIMALTRS